jgi:hypothetical protein
VGGDADGGYGDVLDGTGRGGEGGGGLGIDSWTVGDHQGGQGQDALRLAPGGKLGEAVGADEEEELVFGSLAVDRLEGFHAIVRAGAARFDLGDFEGRVTGDGDAGHFETVGDRRRAAWLVRGLAGDHEPHTVECARFATALGQDQVPEVDRVKRATE